MQRRLLIAAGLASPLAQAATCGRPQRLPGTDDFTLKLLAAALEAGGCASSLAAQAEADGPAALREGRLDVAVVSSLAGQPPGVLVVREPLRRGLPGLRLLVTPLARVAGLLELHTLDELKRRCTVGCLTGDAVGAEYRRLGLRTVTAPTLLELYGLLRRGEADLLSRSVAEAWDEIDAGELGRADAMALPRPVLSQPLDDFFAVRADATALHAALSTGLRALQRNGGYRRLFDPAYGLALRRSGLMHREVIALPALRPDPAIEQAQAQLLRG